MDLHDFQILELRQQINDVLAKVAKDPTKQVSLAVSEYLVDTMAESEFKLGHNKPKKGVFNGLP